MFDSDPDPGSGLTQGDIVRVGRLYRSTYTADGSVVEGGIYADTDYAVVLSRPCHCANLESTKFLTVAALVKPNDKILDALKGARTHDNVSSLRRALEALRDGAFAKDSFYLGGHPKLVESERWCVSLGTVTTIQLPDKARDRRAWVPSVRVARLRGDAMSALLVRLRGFFESQGFDDLEWCTDVDLEMLHRHAQTRLSEFQLDQGLEKGDKESKARTKLRQGIELEIRWVDERRQRRESVEFDGSGPDPTEITASQADIAPIDPSLASGHGAVEESGESFEVTGASEGTNLEEMPAAD